MKKIWARQWFDGEHLLHEAAVSVIDGIISEVTPGASSEGCQVIDALVVPGLVDLQVNGGGGVLFCQQPTPEVLATMVAAHAQYGTRHMLPTVITSDLPTLQSAADAVATYLATAQPGVFGVHFEGPHLDAARAGIHNKQRFTALSDKHMALYTRKDIGRVMVTVAPETVPPDVIKDLVEKGVVVSLGHTNADYDTALAAFAAGATSATHLFNAMSGLVSRAPGVVGATLAADNIYAGLIADGHHVHHAALKIAFKALGSSRAYLVTDAMGHVGCDEKTLMFEQKPITQDNGKLTISNGTLAGSCLDMTTAIYNAVNLCGVPVPMALQMATSTPANCMACDHQIGYLKADYQANYITLPINFFD